ISGTLEHSVHTLRLSALMSPSDHANRMRTDERQETSLSTPKLDRHKFNLLPASGGEYRARLFSAACLGATVLGTRSCRPTNKIACASTDAHGIRVGRGSGHNVLKLK